MEPDAVIEETRRWILSMVIGLDLCPFAKRVFRDELIRYVVTEAEDVNHLRGDLAAELRAVASSPITTVETTLLIHPRALADFRDYNDFLGDADRLLEEMGFRGVIQIASFHPDYQFAGTDADAVENFTNRAPYAMLHLLREESISKVAGDPEELLEIPKHNVRTLRRLGKEKVAEMLKAAARR